MFSTNYFQVQYLIKKPKKKIKNYLSKNYEKKTFSKNFEILNFFVSNLVN